MDERRFDDLARALATRAPRRALLAALAGAAFAPARAALGGTVSAQEVGTAACLGIGARCGRRRQPNCGDCCSGFAARQQNGQRRCACRPDGGTCRRDDQCCSGLCCVVDGRRICIPGVFACNGACPTDACSAQA